MSKKNNFKNHKYLIPFAILIFLVLIVNGEPNSINKEILNAKVQVFLEMAELKNELQERVKMLTLLNEENRKMQKKIQHLASHDYLTGLINRRKLDEEFQRQEERIQKFVNLTNTTNEAWKKNSYSVNEYWTGLS